MRAAIILLGLLALGLLATCEEVEPSRPSGDVFRLEAGAEPASDEALDEALPNCPPCPRCAQPLPPWQFTTGLMICLACSTDGALCDTDPEKLPEACP